MNILLVISDQMVPHLTGAYGHPVVQTPNLDRLRDEGVRFDAAYTPCPICAPARACLMTGTYTSTNGVYDNAAQLPSDIPSFADHLTNAGYECVLSGKMHFVGADQLHGFNRRLTTDIYPSDFRWVKDEWIRIKEANGEGYEAIMASRDSYHSRNYTGAGVRVNAWNGALSYDEETHFRSLEYLHAVGAQKPGDRMPFCLCASYHHPHEVFWPPQEYWDLYEDAPIDIPDFPDDLAEHKSAMDRWLDAYHGTTRNDLRDPDGLTRLRRAYYALVTYMDRKLGELLDSLDENGLADDTVVIFVSDHGDMLCEREMVQKRTFYEWSARVPFLVRFPDGSHAGKRITQPVSLIDLLPTMCELAGVDDQLFCDGTSVLPLLDDDTEPRVVFSEMHSEAVARPCFMVRRGSHKYVYIHGHDEQLFDLSADPDEWNDLSDDPASANLKAELKQLILDRFGPDAIAADVLVGLRRRRTVKDAMGRNRTDWDHYPRFDARRNAMAQYLRPS